MSRPNTHIEHHERIRAAAKASGLSAALMTRFTRGAIVLAVMPDEQSIKRKQFFMGPATFKGILNCIREAKAMGIRQDTVWAVMADMWTEYINTARAERDLPPMEQDVAGIYEEFLDSQTNPQYERKVGAHKKGERLPRIAIDDRGVPLDVKPAPSEKQEKP